MPYPKYVEKGESITAQWGNDVVSAIRRRRKRPKRNISVGGGGGTSAACPFGEIISLDDETSFNYGIAGGVCLCESKNFNVPYKGLNATSAVVLVSLKLTGIQFNTDTDNQFIMPGLKGATGTPEFDYKPWSAGVNYPDNINPSTPTATGTIYVPLGLLTTFATVSGSTPTPTFEATGCGSIRVLHCGGILTYERFV